jgi:hypothetical protein
LPEVGKELLELAQAIASALSHRLKGNEALQSGVVPQIRRLLKLAVAMVGFLLYVWYVAVRNVPRARARRERRRRSRNLC